MTVPDGDGYSLGRWLGGHDDGMRGKSRHPDEGDRA
jgi:hypothetical protein